MKLLVCRLHQIEVTSHCNLRCVYCTSPNLQRPKLHMTEEHFRRALEYAKYFAQEHGQHELNLCGIGESTLHPQFPDFVRLAREAVGPSVSLVLATNGLLFDEALAEKLQPYNLKVWVSMHRPEKARGAILAARKYGMLQAASMDPVVASINWAGQVDWPVTLKQQRECNWLSNSMMMAMADGRLTTCCLDSSGIGVIGHLDDEIGSHYTQPYELCKTCDQRVPIIGWDQAAGKLADATP